MAALDFGRNRFAVTNSSSTSTKAHPRVRMGLFSPLGASYVDAVPPVIDLARAGTLSFRIFGTRSARPSHGQINFGMFGSGRYTQSDYVPPPPDWMKKIIIVM